MIHVGADLHERFCYMTALDAMGRAIKAGPVANRPLELRRWLRDLPRPVNVAVEACSFWPAFQEAIGKQVDCIRLVHPQRVKAIASAKLKNDRVDSATLAHLLRCDLLPEAWMADRDTRERRQQVRLRISLGQHRAALKNQVHAILHQHGKRSPVSDTFGKKGREWLRKISLPPVARETVETYCTLIDQVGQQIRKQELRLKEMASEDARAQWLATIPGVGTYSAMILLSEIGDIARFPTAKALFSYAGLVPWVRESAGHQSRGGISRCGSPRLRWVMVEAAHTAMRSSPVARGYFDRLRKRHKHAHVARVALARKLLAAVFAMLRDGTCFDETIFAAV
jgi:transposase